MSDTVWLAWVCGSVYEGDDLVGIYATEEAAKHACAEEACPPRVFLGAPRSTKLIDTWRRTYFDDDADPREHSHTSQWAETTDGQLYRVTRYQVQT